MKYKLPLLHNLYHWTLKWASHPRAVWALFFISFIESSVFLIPPDILLIPMVLARPKRWFGYAALTTVGSVLGGIAGYYIGFALWESVGKAIVAFYHAGPYVDIIKHQYELHAFATIFTAAFTPIPYKVITIAAGLFRISLFTLIIASVIGRGLRFFLVAGAVGYWGDPIRVFIEKYFDLLTIMFVVGVVGGFVVLKFLF